MTNMKSKDSSGKIVSREPATAAQLSALMGANNSGGSEEDDYDMHELTKAEKKKLKKAERCVAHLSFLKLSDYLSFPPSGRFAKRKNRNLDGNGLDDEPDAGFTVNTSDERFFSVMRNSSNFGIDPTATEFKPTEGMNKILKEQRRLRQLEEERQEEELRTASTLPRSSENSIGDADMKRKRSKIEDVAPLVDRLKKKYKSK